MNEIAKRYIFSVLDSFDHARDKCMKKGIVKSLMGVE